MKKILIIVKRQFGSGHSNTQLINEYVEAKKSQGYQLELIGDDTGVLKELLDEQELWGKKITSAQSNVMFELGSYELIIYVPEEAAELQDILVYDPNKLDKNMIFYNIGNMLIVDSLGEEDLQQRIEGLTERAEQVESLPTETSHSADSDAEDSNSENSDAQNGTTFETQVSEEKNEESLQEDLMPDALAAESESEVFVSDEVTDMEESDEQNSEFIADADFVEPEGATAENAETYETVAQDISSTETNEAKDESETDSTEEYSGEAPNMQEHFSSNYSVIGENGESVSTDEQKTEETKAREIGEKTESVQEEVPSSNILDNIDEIHSDSLITISSDGLTTTSAESYSQNPAQESTHGHESATEPEHHEVKKGVSIPRRLWLLVPWIIMGLMTILKYEKVAWIPFILSVLALFGAILSKKSRRLSKTPEFLCIIMAILALIVNFVYPEWMAVIALQISIMGIVLFFIAGFVNWDN